MGHAGGKREERIPQDLPTLHEPLPRKLSHGGRLEGLRQDQHGELFQAHANRLQELDCAIHGDGVWRITLLWLGGGDLLLAGPVAEGGSDENTPELVKNLV
jgi:hypothetical protein